MGSNFTSGDVQYVLNNFGSVISGNGFTSGASLRSNKPDFYTYLQPLYQIITVSDQSGKLPDAITKTQIGYKVATNDQSSQGGIPSQYNRSVNQYGDPNVTINQFSEQFAGKTENQIITGKTSFMGMTWANDIQPRQFRFVQDPKYPSREIDMIHFFVVGRMGNTMGLLNELQQILRGNFGSAFYPQDIYSNILGIKFFNQYGDRINQNPTQISNYLQEFLNNR